LPAPPERAAEPSVAAGRRESEDREARLLLRERCGVLEPADGPVRRRAALEHRRMGRDREQVLGEAVVDLARDPGPLLGHCATELREADRPPNAGEEQAGRGEAEEGRL